MATRIFFTSDVHGSEKCFKKFLNAADFYKVQVLILGGDITGKMIIPIINKPHGYEFTLNGISYTIKDEVKLKEAEQQIRDCGYYPFRTGPEEAAKYSSSDVDRDKLFTRLMVERVGEWVGLADLKLASKGIKCFVNPGNDDIFEVDQVLSGSGSIIMPEGKVLQIDDSHEMISTGFANHTPWDCPRDTDEAKLRSRIDDMVSNVTHMENCIFNFHVPPYNTKLDEAPKLDDTLRPVKAPGGCELVMEPVGSLAIREAIQKYQPLLGLHGHIHESRGANKLGRTLVLNCGSEYSEGILHGIIVTLDGTRVNYQFTAG